ncbi:MAG: MarR family transcriptional regulator [Oscillospiraceae bacterium]|jgi:DNA-binding MarR family transcriptional regulator|nr:MarR family transcriptional regulator [Oscillospiraceae bacterium]
MQKNEHQTGLVILLSEKYGMVRKRCEQLWNREGFEKISASERYLLSRISGHALSISEIARLANITRQAAHKFVKGLQKKGLLQIVDSPENNRDKLVQFTPLGDQCMEKCLKMERLLEEEISEQIGAGNMDRLKTLLSEKWFF